jgi:hypothetical protein
LATRIQAVPQMVWNEMWNDVAFATM